jgi:hypothetical protein
VIAAACNRNEKSAMVHQKETHSPDGRLKFLRALFITMQANFHLLVLFTHRVYVTGTSFENFKVIAPVEHYEETCDLSG